MFRADPQYRGKNRAGLGYEAGFPCGCWLMEKPEAALKAITRNPIAAYGET